MGNGYHQQQINHKGTFLPLLCSKPSIKDVILPEWQLHNSSSLSHDPLSPKISCMGQVKRNNKINYVGFPAVSYKLSNVSSKNSFNNSVKYFKLKKLFYGKNLTGSPAAATMKTSTSCRRRQVVVVNGTGATSKVKSVGDGKENSEAASNSINIETMDPPLPVINKRPKQGDDHNTLWKRRSRGVALEGLQLQQIQLKTHQEPTTV